MEFPRVEKGILVMRKNKALINAACNRLFLLLMLLLFPAGVQAGPWNGWVYQDPFPTMDTLLSVKFVTPEIGWVVGERGAILHTESGGNEWEYQDSGTENDLKSVTFVNKQVGWVVGNGGVILYTDDGGKKWTRQGDGKDSLHIVFFINEKEGWTGGADGTLLHTEDGGKIWQQVDIGSYLDVAGIFFRDKETGWVLSGGRVFRTADGGKSWEVSALPAVTLQRRSGPTIIAEHGWTGGVYFFDEKRGLATVGLWFVFSTDDGGITWKAIEIPNTAERFAPTDEKSGCLVGSSILCTKDGGMSWEEKLGTRPGEQDRINGYMVTIWGISFVDRLTGWGVGNKGQVWKTEDGGKSWKVVSRPFSFYHFVNSTTGWDTRSRTDAKRRKTDLVKTTDGGKTWTIQKVFDAEGVGIQFYFVNDTTGWAVGEEWGSDSGGSKLLNIYIIHTNDGGKTWTTQFTEPAGTKFGFETRLIDVFFLDKQSGWVVGSNGLILHTKNGGRKWEYLPNGPKLYLNRIHFFNNSTGIMIADNGSLENENSEGGIYLTKDGGKSWKCLWRNDGIQLDAMDIKNDNVLVLGEDNNGSIIINYNRKNKNLSLDHIKKTYFGKVFISKKNTFVLYSNFGKIFISDDNGKTWRRKNIPINRKPWNILDVL